MKTYIVELNDGKTEEVQASYYTTRMFTVEFYEQREYRIDHLVTAYNREDVSNIYESIPEKT